MDMQRTARDIGLFETAVNLAKVCKSADVIQKVGGSMPLSDEDISGRTVQAAKWLCGYGKKKYFFLTPEIALIDAMGAVADKDTEIILAVPCDLENEAKERLYNNLPRNMTVTMLEESYFPQDFFPGNGIMVVCGYSGNDRVMVMPDTYRMVEHYSGFLGRKVFLPYREMDTAARFDGWMEVGQQRLSDKWRYMA